MVRIGDFGQIRLGHIPRLGHEGLLVDGAAGGERRNDLGAVRALERVALEVGVDLAAQHFGQAGSAGVEGDKNHVAANAVLDAGRVHGVFRAERFVIILADNYIELARIGLAVGFHDGLAAILREVAGLGVEDIPAIVIRILLEAIGTADLSGGTGGAFDDQDVQLLDALELGIGLQPGAGRKTFVGEFGADPGDVLVGVIDRTVNHDHGDSGVLSFAQNGVPAGGDDRVDDDVIDALLDEVADRLKLSCGIVVAVHELEVEAVVLAEGGLDGVGGSGAPVGFMTDLGKTDGDQLAGGRCGSGCGRCRSGRGRAGSRGRGGRGRRGRAGGGRAGGIAGRAGHKRGHHDDCQCKC